MIIGNIAEIERYNELNPNFQAVFNFISQNDLLSLAPGEYPVENGKSYVIIAEAKNDPEFIPNMEIHKKYIDIQLALSGSFPIAWAPINKASIIKVPYNEEKDYEFYEVEPDITFQLEAGNFAILFTEDVHAALTPANLVKKAIFKVIA